MNLHWVYQSVDSCAVNYEKYIANFARHTSNSKVLDVGCGLGNYTSLFNINNNQVAGIDIIDFRSDLFKKDFKFVKYDGRNFPFPSQTFDTIICLDVIEHIKDDLFTAREIKQVLKPGGNILIATPNRNRLSSIFLKLIGRERRFPYIGQADGIGGKSVHEREYADKELAALFRNAGFNKIKIEYFWFGLRGKINCGIKFPLIKQVCHCFFLTNE